MAEFISDNSTQTTSVFSQGNLYTSKTNPNLRLSTSSGIYYPSINNVRIYTNSIDAVTIDSNQIIYGNGAGLTNFTTSQIPSLDANKITSGTFATSFIPSLDVSKITTGTFAT